MTVESDNNKFPPPVGRIISECSSTGPLISRMASRPSSGKLNDQSKGINTPFSRSLPLQPRSVIRSSFVPSNPQSRATQTLAELLQLDKSLVRNMRPHQLEAASFLLTRLHHRVTVDSDISVPLHRPRSSLGSVDDDGNYRRENKRKSNSSYSNNNSNDESGCFDVNEGSDSDSDDAFCCSKQNSFSVKAESNRPETITGAVLCDDMVFKSPKNYLNTYF